MHVRVPLKRAMRLFETVSCNAWRNVGKTIFSTVHPSQLKYPLVWTVTRAKGQLRLRSIFTNSNVKLDTLVLLSVQRIVYFCSIEKKKEKKSRNFKTTHRTDTWKWITKGRYIRSFRIEWKNNYRSLSNRTTQYLHGNNNNRMMLKNLSDYLRIVLCRVSVRKSQTSSFGYLLDTRNHRFSGFLNRWLSFTIDI